MLYEVITCSGDMYGGVPRRSPSSVREASSASRSRARPKSRMTGRPPEVTMSVGVAADAGGTDGLERLLDRARNNFV